jgi:hypothetical protein
MQCGTQNSIEQGLGLPPRMQNFTWCKGVACTHTESSPEELQVYAASQSGVSASGRPCATCRSGCSGVKGGGEGGSGARRGGSTSLGGSQSRGVVGLCGSRRDFSKVRRITCVALLAPPSVTLGVPDVGAPTDDLFIRVAFLGGRPLAWPCRRLDLFCNVWVGLGVLLWPLTTCIPGAVSRLTAVPTDCLPLTEKHRVIPRVSDAVPFAF